MSTPVDRLRDREFRDVLDFIEAHAVSVDEEGGVSREAVDRLGSSGILACQLPVELGGWGAGELVFGEICAAVGSRCTNTRSLVTVHSLVAAAIGRWGTAAQRSRWLPAVASGTHLAAFCLTEPNAGSDAGAVETQLVSDGTGWRLSGEKTWVCFGATASLLFVVARCEQGPTAVVLEIGDRTEGVERTVRSGALGLRGALVADLRFDDVRVEADRVIGPAGSGVTHVAQAALHNARFSVAWGCVGMIAACLESSVRHARDRQQSGSRLAEHQLVRRHLAQIAAHHAAARAVCVQAAEDRTRGMASAIQSTVMAKYVASRGAASAASDAVQVHGAAGCERGSVPERMYRDSKIMQIIEGSDEVGELLVSGDVIRRVGRENR